MRVLHINTSPGGNGRYGALFGSGLQSLPDVESLSVIDHRLRDGDIMRDLTSGDGWYVVREAQRRSTVAIALELMRIARRFRPDVIHDSAGSAMSVGLLAWPLLARIAPLVMTEFDPVPHLGMGGLRRSAVRSLARRVAAHTLVHGPVCRQQVIDQGVAPERVTVIRHGHYGAFDRGAYAEVQREPSTILFFGAMRPNKGFDLLLPIADRVCARHPEARFLVVGSKSVSRELIKRGWLTTVEGCLAEMARRPEFEVDERFVADEEIERYFRRAGITLLPYVEGSDSGVALLGLTHGSLVVSGRFGDIEEVIHDGETGLLCEATADGLADRLCDALADRAAADRIAEAGHELAWKRCRWEDTAAAARKVYDGCLRRG